MTDDDTPDRTRQTDPRRPWTASYGPGVPLDIEPVTEPVTRNLDRAARAHPARVATDFLGAVTP